jgi:hypothetical protein
MNFCNLKDAFSQSGDSSNVLLQNYTNSIISPNSYVKENFEQELEQEPVQLQEQGNCCKCCVYKNNKNKDNYIIILLIILILIILLK